MIHPTTWEDADWLAHYRIFFSFARHRGLRQPSSRDFALRNANYLLRVTRLIGSAYDNG